MKFNIKWKDLIWCVPGFLASERTISLKLYKIWGWHMLFCKIMKKWIWTKQTQHMSTSITCRTIWVILFLKLATTSLYLLMLVMECSRQVSQAVEFPDSWPWRHVVRFFLWRFLDFRPLPRLFLFLFFWILFRLLLFFFLFFSFFLFVLVFFLKLYRFVPLFFL